MKCSLLISLLIELTFVWAGRKRKKKSSSESSFLDSSDFWKRIKRTRSDRFDLGDGLNFQLNEAAWYDHLPTHRQGDMNYFFSDSTSSGSSFEDLRRREQKQRKKRKKLVRKRPDDKISWRDEVKIAKLKGKRLQKRGFRHRLQQQQRKKKKSRNSGFSSLELAYSRDRDINKNLRFVSDFENLDLRYVNPFCSYAIPSYEEDLRKRRRHRRLVELAKRKRERLDQDHRWRHRDYTNVLYDYVKDDEAAVVVERDHDREIRDLKRKLLEERKARKRAELKEKVESTEPEVKAMEAKRPPKNATSNVRLTMQWLLPIFITIFL